MATPTPPRAAPSDSLRYAESLYRYAAQRLDAFSLRCWIIQRLMLDDGLDHASAERTFEDVFELVCRARRVEDLRAAQRQRRRELMREMRRSVYRWTPTPPIGDHARRVTEAPARRAA